MVSDATASAVRAIPLRLPAWVVEAAFFGLLFLVFVGRTPFSPPAPIAQMGGTNPTGAGDAIRQISYIAIFVVLVAGALQKRGIRAFRAMPIVLALLLAWCVASSF